MKKLVYLFATLFIVAIATENVKGQATETGDATAKILLPITIVKDATLDFGTIAPRSQASTVVINATNGTRTLGSGDAQLVPSAEGARGTFMIKGEPNAGFSIAIPTGTITLTNSNSETMSVGTFVSSLGASSTLDTDGEAVLGIGATLSVSATQDPGIYNGRYDVTVAYN